MTRRLPWKRSGDEAPASSPLRRVKAQSPELPPLSPDIKPVLAHSTPLKRSYADSSDPIRSSSLSPPPEIPQEESMISGDDKYRMVEDELLRVAQRFTAHLHREAYERMKADAKKQNAATIREIERPVVHSPSVDARRRIDRVQRGAKQRKLLKTGPETSAASPNASSNLRGLLETPRHDNRNISLGGPSETPVKSRLAESSIPSPLRQAAQASSSARNSPSLPQLSSASSVRSRVAPATPGPSSRVPQHSSPLVRRQASDHQDDSGDIDSDDPFGLKERQLLRKQSREQFKNLGKGKGRSM